MKAIVWGLLIVLLLIACGLTGVRAQAGPEADGAGLDFVGDVTGPLGGGRDLGIACGSYLFFGDTFTGVSDGNGPAGAWAAPNSGAVIVGSRADGTPVLNALNGPFAALFGVGPGANTVTPTGCVVVGGVIYLRYMEIISNAGHDFEASGAGIATSYDGGLTWTKTALWQGDTLAAQATLALGGDGLVYALSTKAGRTGPAFLSRVPVDAITNPDAWTFWDGSDFGGGIERAAAVIDGTVGEIGLCRGPNGWRALYMSPAHNAIVARESALLRGPWSDPAVVLPWVQGSTWGLYAPQPLGTSCREWLVSDFARYRVELWRLQ